MQKKDLEQELKLEGKKFTPNNIDKIYASLGIELSSSKKVDAKLEKAIKEEGDILVKNDVDSVYASLGISRNTTGDLLTQNKIKNEKNDFVPDVKKDVYTSLNMKAPSSGFLSFIKRPMTIGITASILVAGITSAIIIPTVFRNNPSSEIVDNSNNIDNGNIQNATPLFENNISLNIVSASKAYSSNVDFVVKTDGKIDTNKIVTNDDQSAYILENIDEEVGPQIQSALGNDESLISFTEKYLSSALKCGVIERRDSSNTNSIKITFDTTLDNGVFYNQIKSDLGNALVNFIKENKIVAEIELAESTVEPLAEIEDPYLAELISDLYKLSTSVFVYSDGRVLEDAYFSSDIKDWVEVFKDYPIRVLEELSDFLWYFDHNIKTDEEKDQTLDLFQEKIASPKEEIAYLNSYLPELSNARKNIEAQLIEKGIYSAEEIESYDNIVWNLGSKYYPTYEGFDYSFYLYHPNDELRTWKWWEEGLNHYKGFFDITRKPDYHYEPFVTPDWFKEIIEEYETKTFEDATDMDLWEVLNDQYVLELFRDSFIEDININFNDVFSRIARGDFNHGERPDDEFNHYEEEPDNWDYYFDQWWDSYGHHHHGW